MYTHFYVRYNNVHGVMSLNSRCHQYILPRVMHALRLRIGFRNDVTRNCLATCNLLLIVL